MGEEAAGRGPTTPVRIGLIVNPVAGLGGRVGLKGSDGRGTARRALAMGAKPQAGFRAAEALRAILAAWPARLASPVFSVPRGAMGLEPALDAGVGVLEILSDAVAVRTTAEDTRRAARAMAEQAVDLLLFAGGDGTARDVHAAVGDAVPVLGIPAGVKIQSAVFATGPAAAGRVAAEWLASRSRRTEEREVLDLDEDAYRSGEVRPALHGYLRVPRGRAVQSRKAPSPPGEVTALAGIAAAVLDELDRERPWVLGPGTSVRAVAERLGVAKTLVGVDVVEWRNGQPRVVVADGGEHALLRAIGDGPAHVVVTPVGGQGFLFGRGNQPISSAVLRAARADGIIVVATPRKLAELGGRPLLVDTGDAELDAQLQGTITVITGYRERAIVPVAVA